MSKNRTPRPFEAPKTPVFKGNGHNYQCTEGKKRCYLRYLANGQRSLNKKRKIACAAARTAADAIKCYRTPRGWTRALRRAHLQRSQ